MNLSYTFDAKFKRMDIAAIKPGINRVLIQLHPHNDKVKFLDGYLQLDTSYEPQDHISVIGKVISIGQLKPLDTSVNSDVRLDWWPEQVLEPEDIVFLDYHAVLMALGQREGAELVEGSLDTFFLDEGRLFVFVSYASVLLACRDNAFIMPNGFVLVKRLMERPESGLIVPDYLKNQPHKFLCEVIQAGLPNRKYMGDRYSDVDEFLHPGKHIVVKMIGMIKLENDMHATLPKDWYVIQRRWIFGMESIYITEQKRCLRTVEQSD
jgi:hypothetical protein